jgi:uncharacterized protein YggE
LAAAAGVELGQLRSLAEGAAGGALAFGSVVHRAAAAAMPVEPGDKDLSVQVAVTYEIVVRELP